MNDGEMDVAIQTTVMASIAHYHSLRPSPTYHVDDADYENEKRLHEQLCTRKMSHISQQYNLTEFALESLLSTLPGHQKSIA